MTRPVEPVQECVSSNDPNGEGADSSLHLLERLLHELRTPLGAAIMWIDVWRRGTPSQQRNAVNAIERSMHAELRIIEAVVDYCRSVRGALELARDEFDLADVVREAVAAAEPQAVAKGIALESAIPSPLGMVAGDTARLGRVFGSLLSNAFKFTPSGGRVSVRAGRTDGEIFVSIEDNGRGIPAEALGRLFVPRADAGPSQVSGGLGLGLALSRRIIELHGGRIAAESAGDGLGSTFTVTIPARDD